MRSFLFVLGLIDGQQQEDLVVDSVIGKCLHVDYFRMKIARQVLELHCTLPGRAS